MSAERLRLLASFEALRRHERNGDDDGFGVRDGHKDEFATCPHPDCLLVRSALGDTGRATPAAPSQEIEQSIAELRMAKDLLRQAGTDPEAWIDGVIQRLAAVRAPSGEPPTESYHFVRDPMTHYNRGYNAGFADAQRERRMEGGQIAPSGEGRWQPIETLDDPDREVLMWAPRERLYSKDTINANPNLPIGEQRVSSHRHWPWAMHWQPLPAPPGSGDSPRTESAAHSVARAIKEHLSGKLLVGPEPDRLRYALLMIVACARQLADLVLAGLAGSGDDPRQVIPQGDLPSEAAKVLRDHAWELIGDGPPPCESDCNPYVATCGARFCTDEARQQHELTCGAVPPPEELR